MIFSHVLYQLSYLGTERIRESGRTSSITRAFFRQRGSDLSKRPRVSCFRTVHHRTRTLFSTTAITFDEREARGDERYECRVLVESGRITFSGCHCDLRNGVRGSVECGRPQVVLSLEAVPCIESDGHGERVSSHASVVQLEGTLRLTSVNPRLTDTFDGVGLRNVFRIIDRPRPAGARTVVSRDSGWPVYP